MTRPGALLPGLFLLLIGGWIMARNLGVPVAGLDRLWPVLPLAGGLAFLAQYFLSGRREEGLVFVGVAAALTGGFLFAFTLGPLSFATGDLARWWPVFVLIGAAAFLAQWAARPRQWSRLAPAVLALLVGGVALGTTLGYLPASALRDLLRLWPVLLILTGIATLVRYFQQGAAPRR